MTFYEGGESSNGEVQATVDTSAVSAASPSEKGTDSLLPDPIEPTPATVSATPATLSEQ